MSHKYHLTVLTFCLGNTVEACSSSYF